MNAEQWATLNFVQQRTVTLAMILRNQIETLHAEYIPDSVMPALNRAARSTIHEFFEHDQDCDEPIDDVWYTEFANAIFDAWQPWIDQYMPADKKQALHAAIEFAIDEHYEVFIEVRSERELVRNILMIPAYWEMPWSQDFKSITPSTPLAPV